MVELAIIMSVYKNDRLKFVQEAVESVLHQTYCLFDFYIIADGELEKNVDNYLSSIVDSRVKYKKRKENKGLAFSLNEMLEIVLRNGYEFVARMDADDIAMRERFERQVDYLVRNKNVDCVGSWAIEIKMNGEEYFRKKMPVSHDECYHFFMKRDCMIHPTVMFRKSYFLKAGKYPEDTYFGEDTMMWANGFACNCIFANIPEFLLKFRLDDNFFDRRRGWKHASSIFQLRRRVNKLLHYPLSADIYAFMYAVVKMLPEPILNLAYKVLR